MALSTLLHCAILEEYFECIKLFMILSQTFYLQGEKNTITIRNSLKSNMTK